MDSEFYRTKRLPPYVFAEVNKLKAAARACRSGHRRFRHGQSRHAAAQACHRQADRDPGRSAGPPLLELARHPGPAQGPGRLLRRRFNVEIDPEREAIVTLGSKEGLANLAQAITSPGDIILAPNPSYPIHAFGFIIAGAAIRSIPFRRVRSS
jgi:alanine-synthesizing transaminase